MLYTDIVQIEFCLMAKKLVLAET